MQSENTIFIVTLGQTGSSAFAKLINQLGVPIYNKLVGHKDFYENKDLIAENKRLIGNDEELADRAKIIGEPRGDLSGLLKDPRTVVAFPNWHKRYPRAKYIFLMRNPHDIGMDKFLYGRRPDILRQRMKFFYDALRQCPNGLYVHYDMLSFDFMRTMRRVAEYCQVPYRPIIGWQPKYYGQIIYAPNSAS